MLKLTAWERHYFLPERNRQKSTEIARRLMHTDENVVGKQ